jgi:DNA-binding XRE family transcriptional regulator
MNGKGFSNNLDKLINMEKAKRILVSGENVTIQSVMESLANYCEISIESIKQYKRGMIFPSLPIAFRIAEYFHLKVDDVFSLENYELAMGNRAGHKNAKSGRGRKKSETNRECVICKDKKVVAKGLCMKHYQEKRRNERVYTE